MRTPQISQTLRTTQRIVTFLIVFSATLSLFLSSCRPGMQTDAADKIEAHPVQSREDLIAALQAVGAEVSEAGEIEQVFFSPLGQVLKVDGVEIQVFEYPDENLRQSESSTISEDGSSIGTTMVTWIDQPNFWAQGKIIVLYLGIDPDVRGLLDSALGTSLTSHP